MKKLQILLLLVGFSLPTHAQPTRAQRQCEAQNAACVLRVSAARLSIREATGHNDGPEVEATQRAAGARKGDPWCGCEQYVEQKACGLPAPAWAAAATNWSPLASPRTYYVRGRRGTLDSARVGHTVTFFYVNLNRVGHVGRIVAIGRPVRAGRTPRSYRVRAGNTGSGGGRDGGGVHDVLYPSPSLYALANWLY